MGLTADKVLIANVAALKKKYGAGGYRRVKSAVRALVAADKKVRGLKTLLVDISDPIQMRRCRAVAVSKPGDEAQNKNAVDRVYAAMRPHYLVLLDAPDVIPHVLLRSLIPHDLDRSVPSDLPYACDQQLVRRDIADYASVTRVVGRIPGLTGSNDPRFLISQIRYACTFRSRTREEYLSHLAISASELRKSTEQSADNIFRRPPVILSPPVKSPAVRRMLAPLSHFINCHGGEGNPNFYGSQTVVSMSSTDVAKRVRRGTIVSAECCFGAELFSPASRSELPMANAYLDAGAIAFFGSTNIAYGSRDGNGCADLLSQYFLIDVLDGASTGRACLQARQRFVWSQKMEDPVNLKTVAQFTLFGDPSLQPVRSEQQAKAFARHLDPREARRTRRVALTAAGESAVDCSGFPGRKIPGAQNGLHGLVRQIALKRGFKTSRLSVEGFEIVGRDNYGKAMRARSLKQSVFVAMHGPRSSHMAARGPGRSKILVVHTQNNKLVDVVEYVRR